MAEKGAAAPNTEVEHLIFNTFFFFNHIYFIYFRRSDQVFLTLQGGFDEFLACKSLEWRYVEEKAWGRWSHEKT